MQIAYILIVEIQSDELRALNKFSKKYLGILIIQNFHFKSKNYFYYLHHKQSPEYCILGC